MKNSTGLFRKELLPPAASFYTRELGRISRPSRGWAQGRCPFHDSKSGKSFSVNLDNGGFYCHGCQAKGGDIVAFVMKRDRLDFKRAAMALGAWDDRSITSAAEIRKIQRDRDQYRAKQAAKEEQARQERIAACDWLHLLEQVYRHANERLCEVRKARVEKFPGECQMLWEILSDALPQIRSAAAEYSRLAGVGDGE